MEKLQQALQKARAERAAAGHPAPASSAQTHAPNEAGQDDIWAALPEVTPDPARLTRNRVVSGTATHEAMPFDILRTKIVLQMRKHGWKRLAITSATPICGKSTITANLAFGLSRQADIRTLIMEMDLRNPSLARIMDVTPPEDVTRLLDGTIGVREQAVRLGRQVALCLARRRATDPTGLLLNAQTETAIARAEAEVEPDLMIFDTPPVLVSDDTRAFLGRVDCALIVACAEKTTIGQIDNCEREVAEHTNVLGVALNQTRFLDTDAGYGYGYEYGYGTKGS